MRELRGQPSPSVNQILRPDVNPYDLCLAYGENFAGSRTSDMATGCANIYFYPPTISFSARHRSRNCQPKYIDSLIFSTTL
jgi:hypothetical protein